MERRIDHDEEDRESSEYEEMEDEEDPFDQPPKQCEPPPPQVEFQQEYLEEPSEQDRHIHNQINEEIPVTMNIEYEEVYPHNAGEHPDDVVEAEKVYYENEMEDLVYHEIYGEGNEQKLGGDKRIRNIVGTVASCIVCQRSESDKIRLFKWPKAQDLRDQWIHFFKIPESAVNSVNEPYICCYHFSADTFVMVEDRIFWKMTALPKYRHRRPGLSEPFPWETSSKMKMDQQLIAATSADSIGSMGYKIRYRMPYNKHKSRNVHQVAVMTPVAHPHLYYEFHFNRYGISPTKFYACLNCRKAKTESGIRDVIRTIHLDGNKFLSNGDPFTGHHFACRPHNIYDYKSSYRPVGNQNPEFLDEVVYLDEQGDPIEWESVQRAEEGTSEARKEDEEIYQQFDEEPICEEIIETEYPTEPSILMEPKYSSQQEESENGGKSKQWKPPRIRCHICKSHVASTRLLIQHLQKHVSSEKQCKKCKAKISCDSHPISIRRGLCETCNQ